MTRKSLVDTLREKKEESPATSKKKPLAKKATAAKKRSGDSKGAVAKKKATSPKKSATTKRKAPEKAPAKTAPAPQGKVTRFTPEGGLASLIGKDRLGAVTLVDKRTAIVDRLWEGVEALAWEVVYVIDLPILGMTLCKLTYHPGDKAVYVRGVVDAKAIIPRLDPATVEKVFVGRLIGIFPATTG